MPFKMVPWTLLAIGICGGMFILHSLSCAQIHHLQLLVKVTEQISTNALLLFYSIFKVSGRVFIALQARQGYKNRLPR